MKRYRNMKTDYKENGFKAQEKAISLTNKWVIPLSLSLFAFAIVWKLGSWLTPGMSSVLQTQWEDTNGVTVDLPLPNQTDDIETLVANAQPDPLETDPTHQFTVQTGKSLANYFKQAGVNSQELAKLLKTKHAHYLKRIYPGQSLALMSNTEGQLQSLKLGLDPITTLIITATEEGHFISQIEEKAIEKRVAFSGGKILDSFFTAGRHAKLDDTMIMELANIFAYDIDFAQDIKPNDHFKVLFEEHFADGAKVGNGPIVAAEFVNNGNKYQAIRYVDSDGAASYYTPNGDSLRKAFIRTPVQYTRISAHFNPNRYHPILHKIRAHRGVDYAAPTGTPVKAVGNGKVSFVGTKGGYGNTVVLQHGQKYTTLYGHLSKFAKNLKSGQSVKQGQVIGYVGSTGLATGPHLHYEFRINGVHHNPLTVPLPKADGIAKHQKPSFLAYAGELLSLLDMNDHILLAQSDI